MNQQPNILLNGIPHLIDRTHHIIENLDNISFSIPFADLVNHGGWFVAKNIGQKDSLRDVVIPAHLLDEVFDPMNTRYCRNFNTMSYQMNWGTLLIDNDIAQRLKGKLPEIELLPGHSFKVDIEHHRLYLKGSVKHTLPVSLMHRKGATSTPSGQGSYCFTYDKGNKKIYTGTGLHGKLFRLEIPDLDLLDPIGAARNKGHVETLLLTSVRQTQQHRAKCLGQINTRNSEGQFRTRTKRYGI